MNRPPRPPMGGGFGGSGFGSGHRPPPPPHHSGGFGRPGFGSGHRPPPPPPRHFGGYRRTYRRPPYRGGCCLSTVANAFIILFIFGFFIQLAITG